MSRIIRIGTQDYFALTVEKIVQKNKIFYTAKITVKEFEEVAALRPVKSENVEKKYEKKSLFGGLFKNINEVNENNDDEQPFNRPGDKKRGQIITDYLLNNENALIPNSLIVGCKEKQLDDIDISFSEDKFSDEDWTETFNGFNGVFIDNSILYLPLIKESVLIIDGQHRYLGLIGLPEEMKENYEIILSFLVGYTAVQMAEIFYTINYEQKSVDKSLLTYLKNSFLEKVTESSIIYEYIKYLNENEDSPLNEKIKSLKGETGIVSLAFMQIQLQNLVEDQSLYSQKIPIFAEIFEDDKNRYLVLQSLLDYFEAIKKLLDNNFETKLWSSPNSVFTKSIGLGAFIQILPSLIIKILIDKEEEKDHLNIKNIDTDDYYQAIKPITNVHLNEYEKAGGLGLMGKLKKEISKLIAIDHITKEFVYSKDILWITDHYVKKNKPKD